MESILSYNDQSGFSGTFQGAADFKQTSTDNIAYLYDPNGNLIKDKNKGIDTHTLQFAKFAGRDYLCQWQPYSLPL